ncbi:lipoyl(octanoyl) transferase LipB [Nitratifractor sp.]
MTLHRWGLIAYPEARKRMEAIHEEACRDGENHLILCEHEPCFTIGTDGWEESWPVKTIPTDRGGSITCHAPGQLVAYFCFQAPQPALFYRRVLRAYYGLFSSLLSDVVYDRHRPGWYIDNRKVASLGFRYRQGVSLHGVALNVDVDLDFCNRVAPCALEGVRATSLAAEGVKKPKEEIERLLFDNLDKNFPAV